MTDTIFAPASGSGRAGICVVRLSGPRTRSVLDALAGGPPPPRRLSLRPLRHPGTGEVLDRVLVAWFPAPGSYTGEDGAELHIHGGFAVRAAVLRALSDLPSCRAAEPGEFTRRAFLNGRMDLSAVEGLADLIDAETEAQRRQAQRQLDGALGGEVERWRERLIEALARLEAALDFADEGDVPAGLEAQAVAIVGDLAAALARTLDDARRGERLRDGFVVVIVGPPNAGKSTLLNALARREVAIVSEIPGTTRDAIEVRCDLHGLPVTFVDTAGLRETDDPIEREGVARALARARTPTSCSVSSRRTATASTVPASASAPRPIFRGAPTRPRPPRVRPNRPGARRPSRPRHGRGGGRARGRRRGDHPRAPSPRPGARPRRLLRAGPALDRGDTELGAEDVRLALRALGEITGRVDVEQVLDRLFGSFCIGK
jgi:tRNA modification GTPase